MEHLYQIKTRALEIAAELDRKSGPYYADVGEGQGCWHIVRTTPGAENKATDHLAHRGIGVFQPRFIAGSRMRMVRTHEVVDLSEKLLFPGRVFVFCWDILAHWRRIMACPGVHSIMCDGAERPVVVPDDTISRIQILQFELSIPRPKRRKRYASAEVRIVLSTKSYWRASGEERNQVLEKSLGAIS